MPRNQRDETVDITSPLIMDHPQNNVSANGTNNVTISNVAPAGVGTATISNWLRLLINGTYYWIPMWT